MTALSYGRRRIVFCRTDPFPSVRCPSAEDLQFITERTLTRQHTAKGTRSSTSQRPAYHLRCGVDRMESHDGKNVRRAPHNLAKKRSKNLDTQPVVVYKYSTKVQPAIWRENHSRSSITITQYPPALSKCPFPYSTGTGLIYNSADVRPFFDHV